MGLLTPDHKPTRFGVSASDLAHADHIAKVRSLSPDHHKFYTEVEKCSDALRKTNHFLEEIRHGGWRIRQVEKDIEETRLEKRMAGFLKRKQLDFTLRGLAKECDKEVARRERRLPHNIEGVREEIDGFRKKCVK